MRVFGVALALAAACLPSTGTAQPASQGVAPAELTAEQWREDLRFMSAEMKRRHINLYHQVSRERFDQAVAGLERESRTFGATRSSSS